MNTSIVAAVSNSRAMLAAHAASVVFGAVVLGLVVLGVWALIRRNWQLGVLLGASAFLWAQLLFPVSAGLAAAAAAAHMHLTGVHVTEHLDVVVRFARGAIEGQRLAMIGVPAGLLVAIIGFFRSSADYNATSPASDEPLAS
jgi:hypothetical protein